MYDEDTGRTRLVKGDGEILEECVSASRHKEINKQATEGDGQSFQVWSQTHFYYVGSFKTIGVLEQSNFDKHINEFLVSLGFTRSVKGAISAPHLTGFEGHEIGSLFSGQRKERKKCVSGQISVFPELAQRQNFIHI